MDRIDDQVAERLRAEADEAKIQEKLELVKEHFGTVDTHDEDTVIKFKKTFTEGGLEYSYAAIKVKGLWYTTGPAGQKYTWLELLIWLVSGPKPTTEITIMYP